MKRSLQQRVTDLEDQLRNGIKYDKRRNILILVWTARQIRNARRQAARFVAKMKPLREAK